MFLFFVEMKSILKYHTVLHLSDSHGLQDSFTLSLSMPQTHLLLHGDIRSPIEPQDNSWDRRLLTMPVCHHVYT